LQVVSDEEWEAADEEEAGSRVEMFGFANLSGADCNEILLQRIATNNSAALC
jgi:hypothetical protein